MDGKGGGSLGLRKSSMSQAHVGNSLCKGPEVPWCRCRERQKAWQGGGAVCTVRLSRAVEAVIPAPKGNEEPSESFQHGGTCQSDGSSREEEGDNKRSSHLSGEGWQPACIRGE